MKKPSNGRSIARSALATISGVTLFKQAAGVLTEAANTAGHIADLAKALITRPKPRRETFGEAVERLALTDEDIVAVGNWFAKRTAWWFIGAMMGLGFLVFTPLVANPISHALLAGGVMIMCGAKALAWHFRACQVRDRELYAFGPWFFSDIWVRRAYIVLMAMVLAVSLLFAVSAHAADSSTSLHAFNPPAGDTSVSYLREIFGSVIDNIHSGASAEGGQVDSALGAMLGPFNSSILFLGMIFVLYTTVKGTVDSAHDGEVLGKRMSEIWVPIRTVGGTAFLLPLGSGYSLIQIAVLWLAIQSAGIGDAVLSAGLDKIAETNMVSRPNLPDSRALAASIFKAEVCMAAQNKQYTDAGEATRIAPVETSSLVHNGGEVGPGYVAATAAAGAAGGPIGAVAAVGAIIADTTYTVIDFRWAANDGSNKQCGSLTWRESTDSALGAGNTSISKGPILQAQAQAVRQMIADMRPVAEQIVATGKAPAPGTIEAAASRYENAIASAAQAAISQSSDKDRANFIQYARDGGWIYLPTYYNQLIQMNDAVQSAINTLPAMESPNIEEQVVVDYALQNYRDYMSVADEYLKRRDLSAQRAGDQQATEDNSFPTSWESAKRFLSRYAQVGIYKFTQQLAGSNLSHVGQIKAVGDTIIDTAEAVVGMLFTASGATGAKVTKWTAGMVFDTAGALSSISGVLSTFVMALFVFGAWAAYYIPMIPYVAALTAIIKWFVLVFEMVIASPIMAAAHIHPDGHDIVGKAGPGYMLILTIVMWPALTVFGFFGSIWLAQPVTGFVNATYMTAVLGAEHNSFTGLVALVAYVGIYVIIMTGVVHSVFTLVNWLPTNALRVIGGSMGVHGIGDGAEHEAKSNFVAVMKTAKGGEGGPVGGSGTKKTGKPGREGGGGHEENGFSNADHLPESRD